MSKNKNTVQKAEELLPLLKFEQKNSGKWRKNYNQCSITVDLIVGRIEYPKAIHRGDNTTSNLQAAENLVVLECVDRLLGKGYKADRIELEKRWKVGRNEGGKLDILVREQNKDDIYLMIECKTHDKEFESEKEKMSKDGGQLFSYWQQSRSTKIMCLYSSRVEDGLVKYVNALVRVPDEFRKVNSLDEVFTRWNKQFSYKGIFENDASLYETTTKPLVQKDLKTLGQPDGQRIFNQFLEILRHNVVSDKGNAFNKIFNLFLCKICDEDRKEDEELDFQWIEGRDDEYTLMDRLNVLYKKGMSNFLNKDVTDYSTKEIDNISDKQTRKILTELRLYKNQEFAFIDVFNKESFKENTKIVIEIVKLLQGWKIRYNKKQQFLGEFFELLLNTGFKQESGQFFTPVPLVRFIIQSLPIESMIKKKIEEKNTEFLPHIVDFACGSGHFLTEAMDILQAHIQKIDKTKLTTPTQQRKLNGYKVDEFGWAKEYIYGIERDYRLAKTTKLASFLNGDGEASIIHGSGIAPLQDYQDSRLQKKHQFDILVTNPPYAVKGFKNTVEDGKNSFKLFQSLSDKSGDIEILFMERAGQLLKPGGIAAIILPQSFLNGSNYDAIRKIMFEQFELKALVILGSHAFMATGIKTIILFLKKRAQSVTLETKQHWKKLLQEEIIIVNGDIEDKNKEIKFLGYSFSNRRGSEGITMVEESFLFNEKDLESYGHINSHILQALDGCKKLVIPDRLKNTMSCMRLSDIVDSHDQTYKLVFLDFERLRCSNKKVPLDPIETVIDILQSGSRPKGGVGQLATEIWSLGGEHVDEDSGTIVRENMKHIPSDFFESMNKDCHISREDILLNKDGALTGKVGWFDVPKQKAAVNEHLFRIRTDSNKCLQKYMFYYMMTSFFKKQVRMFTHRKKGTPGLNKDHFKRILFPKLDVTRQNKIVKKIDKKWERLMSKGDRTKFVDEVFSEIGMGYEKK